MTSTSTTLLADAKGRSVVRLQSEDPTTTTYDSLAAPLPLNEGRGAPQSRLEALQLLPPAVTAPEEPGASGAADLSSSSNSPMNPAGGSVRPDSVLWEVAAPGARPGVEHDFLIVGTPEGRGPSKSVCREPSPSVSTSRWDTAIASATEEDEQATRVLTGGAQRANAPDLQLDAADAEQVTSPTTTDGTNRFEVHTRRLCNTIVTVFSQDPNFNAVLREVLLPGHASGAPEYTLSLREQRRLAALYEAGMPSWTVFVARKGLMPYRRWIRLLMVLLTNLWPLIALAVGLYDLYKHMPFLKDWLAESFTPFTNWLNEHFTLQLSMMITYLATVSLTVLTSLHGLGRTLFSLVVVLLQPFATLWAVLAMLRYPIAALWSFISITVYPMLILGRYIWAVATSVSLAPFRGVALFFRFLMQLAPGSAAMQATAQGTTAFVQMWRQWLYFWDKVLRPLKNFFKACYDGVVHVGVAIARREITIWRWRVIVESTAARALDWTVGTAYSVVAENWRLARGLVPPYIIPLVLVFVAWAFLPTLRSWAAAVMFPDLTAVNASVAVAP